MIFQGRAAQILRRPSSFAAAATARPPQETLDAGARRSGALCLIGTPCRDPATAVRLHSAKLHPIVGAHEHDIEAVEALANEDIDKDGAIADDAPRKTFRQAATQIVVADVSMSLDNVLAVAGAAKDHPTVLIIGLALSIAMMGIAASWIARLLNKYRWIAYIGLLIILYVALKMMWEGWHEVEPFVANAMG